MRAASPPAIALSCLLATVTLGGAPAYGQQARDPPAPGGNTAALDAVEKWQQCVTKFSTMVAPANPEQPETIVRAAFAVCLPEENNAAQLMIDANRGAGKVWESFVLENILPGIKQTVEQRGIAAVLVARAASRDQRLPQKR